MKSFRIKARELRHAVAQFIWAATSRLLVTPLTWIVPRTQKLWVVIGREHGKYLDNSKYLHAWLTQNAVSSIKVVFIGERPDVLRQLSSLGCAAAHYPGWNAFGYLLRAGTIICDASDFIDHGRIGFFRGARLVQLWHGVPLKEIELPLHARRLGKSGFLARHLISFQKMVIGRYRPVDLVIATSDYCMKRAFAPCIPAHRTVVTGYPRNDVIMARGDYPSSLVSLNVDQQAAARLAAQRSSGRKTVLYAPTFRDNWSSPLRNVLSPDQLSEFSQRWDVIFAMKLHPLMQGHCKPGNYPHLLSISAESDVYPLLRNVDVLITDYSSIFFDYLLLDRPIIFYPYDYAAYVSRERRLLFDYDEMTPGPKVYNVDSLITALTEAVVTGQDWWRDERARVRKLVHDHTDGAASLCLYQVLQS